MKADLIDLKEAQKKKINYFEAYQEIAYGGWAIGGNVAKVKWFMDMATSWKSKRLAIFCVGASPNENPELKEALENLLTEEQRKYMKVFYCQGGINYDKMKMPYRMAMKMFVSGLKKKKDAGEKERMMAEMLSSSYDVSDRKYIDPIVEYPSQK